MKTKTFTKLLTLLAGLMMFANMANTQNMNRWIELTVQQGQWIQLDLWADAANTPVKVVSGTKDTTLIVGEYWTDYKNYYAQTSTMRVYGNITHFDCSNNNENLTGINVSNNTELVKLYCSQNNISSLNVSGCTTLEFLSCNYANLTSLDVSGCTALTELRCYNNNLTSLNFTGCTALRILNCNKNNLTTLDISGCTALTYLNCNENNLTSLNLSGCTALEEFYCRNNSLTSLYLSGCNALKKAGIRGNKFTTPKIDKIYCSLPQREEADKATIIVLQNESDPNKESVMATTKRNATDKNWKVSYADAEYTPIGETTGNYTCLAPETYPLWVAGEQVTSFNASAITGEGITGSVSYIHGTNTLTLNGATITKGKTDGDGEVAILSEIPLTINLIDENEILNSTYPKNYAGILINQSDIPLNITGDGSLNMDVKSSSSGYCLGIFASSNPVNLSCNSLKITSSHVGIASKELHITNGTLEVLGKTMTAINAETVSIYSNALLNEGDEAPGIEVPNLTLTKKYVYIRPNGTGLTSLTSQGIQVCGGKGVIEIQAPKPPKGGAVKFTAHIYNVSGMLVRTLPLQGTEGQVAVPAGIYIVKIGTAIEKVVVR